MALSSCLGLQYFLGCKGDALGAKLNLQPSEPFSKGMQSLHRIFARPKHLRQGWRFHSLCSTSVKATVESSGASSLESLRAELSKEAAAREPRESLLQSSASVSTSGDSSNAASPRVSAAERRRQRKLSTQPDGDAPEATTRAGLPFPKTRHEENAPTKRASSSTRRGAVRAYRTDTTPASEVAIRSGDAELAASPPQRRVTVGEARARQFSDAVRFLNKDTGEPAHAEAMIAVSSHFSIGHFEPCPRMRRVWLGALY